MKTRILIAVSVFGLAACAYRAQVVRLDPALPQLSPEQKSGSAQTISVRAKDARSTQEIGRRSGGTSHETPITTDQDIAGLLKSKISAILEAKGFRTSDSEKAATTVLYVELKELSYQSYTESSDRKIRIRAILTVLAQNGTQRKEKTFETSQDRKILVEPVAKSNEEWINETFSDVLKEFSGDEKLFSFLR